jgi:D-serine deaminase-like pyridoxal phosphate-dependent protein
MVLLKNDLDSPALVLDVGAMERNVAKMAQFFAGKKARLRPHVKAHKCPQIAHRQLEAGAIGITCAKIGEAEVMAESGIRDILIANEIVGGRKIRRALDLSELCDLTVLVDNAGMTQELSREAVRRGTKLRVLLDVNLGKVLGSQDTVERCGNRGILDRCGVHPGKPALELAQDLVKLPGLSFAGLMGYEGGMRSYIDYQSRKEACKRALAMLMETKELLQEHGIESATISSGGTSTYSITGDYPGVTEVQAGSYVLMDVPLAAMQGMDFEYALSVLTTVISRPYPEKAILDVGRKGVTADGGLPIVKGIEGARLVMLNLEHGHLVLEDEARTLRVGDKLELLPTDADTVVNLYDRYMVVRDSVLEAQWPVAARGKMQ